MSAYLSKAFISIEDERFEEHHGVDWKRTMGAIFKFATNGGESSYGGSTLTQQIVKNLTNERDDSGIAGALRKIKEITRAYQVEEILSKDQVMELYLNLIPLGGGGKNICGVQMAARYYFNKDAKDVSIVEAAYIAGITHAPNTYNPFGETDRTERINKRVKTVLRKMNELGKITDEEYNTSLSEVEAGIHFEQGTVSQNNSLTYHAEAAVKEILEDFMQENGWTEDEAKLHLYGDGYQIYTTYDPEIQKAVDNQYVNNSSKWTSKYKKVTRKNPDGTERTEEVRIESAMVIIEPSTGYVVAGSSGFGEKTTAWGKNRMTFEKHSPGSSIKPIAVIGPSLQEGLINAATVVDDTPITIGSYSPHNDTRGYFGLMNIRYILRVSRNIPEVKMMQKLTVKKSLEYLEKFGLDTSTEQNDGLSLALGGMSYGPTVLQMAGAYATIANGGTYIEPSFYSKVTDSEGNTIIESHQETHRVLSEQNAWLLQSLLKEPTGTGLTGASGATGTGARVSGQDTAGKTGTTNDSKAVWFCGFTPYYAAAVWKGYDVEGDGAAGRSGEAARLWGAVMNEIHKGLEKATFKQPDGFKTAVVCSKSGKLVTEACKNDPSGSKAYTEYFVKGSEPKEACDCHVTAKVCKITGKVATDNCKEVIDKVFITRPDEGSAWKSASDAQYMLPTETCDTCAGKVEEPENNTNTVTNPNENTTTNTTTNSVTNQTTNNTTQTNTSKPTNTTKPDNTTKPNNTTKPTNTTKPDNTTKPTNTTN